MNAAKKHPKENEQRGEAWGIWQKGTARKRTVFGRRRHPVVIVGQHPKLELAHGDAEPVVVGHKEEEVGARVVGPVVEEVYNDKTAIVIEAST